MCDALFNIVGGAATAGLIVVLVKTLLKKGLKEEPKAQVSEIKEKKYKEEEFDVGKLTVRLEILQSGTNKIKFMTLVLVGEVCTDINGIKSYMDLAVNQLHRLTYPVSGRFDAPIYKEQFINDGKQSVLGRVISYKILKEEKNLQKYSVEVK